MSTAQNPAFTYTTEGTFTVNLTVTGPGGSDTETELDYIDVTTSVLVTVSFQDGVNGYDGTRDTNLQGNFPNVNFGGDLDVLVDGDPDRSALLSWDVTSIPVGSIVDSATITLDVNSTSNDTYEMYSVKQLWVEDEATWNQYANVI